VPPLVRRGENPGTPVIARFRFNHERLGAALGQATLDRRGGQAASEIPDGPSR